MAFYTHLWFILPTILLILYLLPKYSPTIVREVRRHTRRPREGFQNFIAPVYTNNVYFSRDQTASFIYFDGDGFLRGLNPPNLCARSAKDIIDYKQIGSDAARDFTDKQKSALNYATREADAILYKNGSALRHFGIDQRIMDIPWRFCLTSGTYWEGGMPHTRDGVIFLSTNYFDTTSSPREMIRTMIHERIHLYQKRYRKRYDQWLHQKGYRPTNLHVPLMRQNPDTTNVVYKSPKGTHMYCVYHGPYPQDLHDIAGDSNKEHPYEYFAYKCADYLMRNEKKK